jgi:hypothetical protein
MNTNTGDFIRAVQIGEPSLVLIIGLAVFAIGVGSVVLVVFLKRRRSANQGTSIGAKD